MRHALWLLPLTGPGVLASLVLLLYSAPSPAGTEKGAPDQHEGEDGARLTRAVRTTATLESYTFRVETDGGGPAVAVEGKYQKGRPVWFQADGIEFYRDGEVLVYRQGERWLRSKTGIESDPLRILAAGARVRAARLPHEELDGLDKHLRDARRAEGQEQGDVVYSATLDEEAAKPLAPSEQRPVARGGSARLWVGGDDRVAKYEVRIRVQGRLGDAEVDGTTTRSVAISGTGSTRVQVPEGATKALR